MAWAALLLAGLFEIGWPIGLKLSEAPSSRWLGFGMALVCLASSGILLWFAQRSIPIGTAYAVWTGIGAAGAFAAGVVMFGEPAGALRVAGVCLIVAGVATLKLGS